MRKILAAAALLACAAPALAQPATQSETERNREVVTRFSDLFCAHHVREAFMTYVAPDYIQHNPLAADGRDAAIAAIEPFFASQPGLSCDNRRILVDGNFAAIHYRLRSSDTDRGAAVVDILRLENGMIVEHWDVFQPVPEHSANPHPMF